MANSEWGMGNGEAAPLSRNDAMESHVERAFDLGIGLTPEIVHRIVRQASWGGLGGSR